MMMLLMLKGNVKVLLMCARPSLLRQWRAICPSKSAVICNSDLIRIFHAATLDIFRYYVDYDLIPLLMQQNYIKCVENVLSSFAPPFFIFC